MAANIYRGPIRWIDIPSEPPRWEGPAGTSLMDTRTIEEQSTAGGPEPDVLFATDGEINDPDYEFVGVGGDGAVNGAVKNKLKIGSNPLPTGSTIPQMLMSIFSDASDPDGISGPRPIMPDRRGNLVLKSGSLVHSTPFQFGVGPSASRVTTMLQRAARADVASVDAGELPEAMLRKALGFRLRKYGLTNDDWALLVEPALQSRFGGADDPETSVSDDFNRPDETPITGWGSAGDTWNIVSSEATRTAGANLTSILFLTPLSGSDQESSITIRGGTTSTNQGPSVRNSITIEQTFYLTGNFSNVIYLMKVVGGTQTNMISTALTYTPGDVYRIEVDGSSLNSYVNGSPTLNTTDSAIPSNLYAGMGQFTNNAAGVMDDFNAADIGGPVATPWRITQQSQLIGGGI